MTARLAEGAALRSLFIPAPRNTGLRLEGCQEKGVRGKGCQEHVKKLNLLISALSIFNDLHCG